MSDGMSDMSRLERQAERVRKAAAELADALEDAEGGVRGWSITKSDMLSDINAALVNTSFTMVARV